jgi:hypothetical protein
MNPAGDDLEAVQAGRSAAGRNLTIIGVGPTTLPYEEMDHLSLGLLRPPTGDPEMIGLPCGPLAYRPTRTSLARKRHTDQSLNRARQGECQTSLPRHATASRPWHRSVPRPRPFSDLHQWATPGSCDPGRDGVEIWPGLQPGPDPYRCLRGRSGSPNQRQRVHSGSAHHVRRGRVRSYHPARIPPASA